MTVEFEEYSSDAEQPRRHEDIAAARSLRLLATCHAIVGGLGVVAALGIALADYRDAEVRAIAMALCAANAMFVLSGLCMMWRRYRPLSLIAAILTCLVFPSGTLLGIWTIVVLNGRGVEELYSNQSDY